MSSKGKGNSEFLCEVHITSISFLIALMTIIVAVGTIPLWLSSIRDEYQTLVAYNMTWIFCALLMILGLARRVPSLLYFYNMMLVLHIILFAVTAIICALLAAMIPDVQYLPYAIVSLLVSTTCGALAVVTTGTQLYLSSLIDHVESRKSSIIYVQI
ncbi:hypothetical protein QR680_015689 [Steinernema hermaphroditum]|uniref:Uncharacterized protein n=1 Tax=Steinernema hermaphroditum TaxID=289476 RepID=A0AA39LLC2_9BILA|nr:hypothetical protein QR680_015689 [Steinernema hermaphroditum]